MFKSLCRRWGLVDDEVAALEDENTREAATKAKADGEANTSTRATPEDENEKENRTSLWGPLDSLQAKAVAEPAYLLVSSLCKVLY